MEYNEFCMVNLTEDELAAAVVVFGRTSTQIRDFIGHDDTLLKELYDTFTRAQQTDERDIWFSRLEVLAAVGLVQGVLAGPLHIPRDDPLSRPLESLTKKLCTSWDATKTDSEPGLRAMIDEAVLSTGKSDISENASTGATHG